MSDEKEDYRIDDQVQERPSGFDLAKIVSDMLKDPETFNSCQRLGEAVLSKPDKQEPKRRDPMADRLIYFSGKLNQSVLRCGDPFGFALILVDAALLNEIFITASKIKDNECADALLKLSVLISHGGVCIMSDDIFDQIDEALVDLIEDLGGEIDL